MASETPPRPVSPLKARRLQQDLRLADVAAAAECSISLVSMTESGYQPPVPTQERIARAVGASAGSFWPTVGAA